MMVRPSFSISLFSLFLIGRAFGGSLPPSPGDLTVAIPFEFAVGQKIMPAGNYLVHRDHTSGDLHICEDSLDCITVKSTAIEKATPSVPSLRLSRSDHRHRLIQVWLGQQEGYRLATKLAGDSVEQQAGNQMRVCIVARPICIHRRDGKLLFWH